MLYGFLYSFHSMQEGREYKRSLGAIEPKDKWQGSSRCYCCHACGLLRLMAGHKPQESQLGSAARLPLPHFLTARLVTCYQTPLPHHHRYSSVKQKWCGHISIQAEAVWRLDVRGSIVKRTGGRPGGHPGRLNPYYDTRSKQTLLLCFTTTESRLNIPSESWKLPILKRQL